MTERQTDATEITTSLREWSINIGSDAYVRTLISHRNIRTA